MSVYVKHVITWKKDEHLPSSTYTLGSYCRDEETPSRDNFEKYVRFATRTTL